MGSESGPGEGRGLRIYLLALAKDAKVLVLDHVVGGVHRCPAKETGPLQTVQAQGDGTQDGLGARLAVTSAHVGRAWNHVERRTLLDALVEDCAGEGEGGALREMKVEPGTTDRGKGDEDGGYERESGTRDVMRVLEPTMTTQ